MIGNSVASDLIFRASRRKSLAIARTGACRLRGSKSAIATGIGAVARRASGWAFLLPLCFLALVMARDARAQTAVPVDLELVLAVDVSGSINVRELEIQRGGYAVALLDDDVLAAIARGYRGQVAMAYMEWAEAESQRLLVDWTLIRDKADAQAFVARIAGRHDPGLRLTSISHAIDFAAALFQDNGFESPRQVIDISGDGPSNDGRIITHARDDAVALGVTINGLPLMTREGDGANWYLDDLDKYYRNCVVGGFGAFVIPVLRWADFPDAVRRKLLLELSGVQPPPAYAVAAPGRPRLWRVSAGGYNCRYGDPVWGPREWYEDQRQPK